MKVIVGRHINGISLNGLEYLLDKRGEVKEFGSKKEAICFLKSKGASEDEIYYMRFINPETGEEQE